MFAHGIYGLENFEGTIEASVLSWSHTDESGAVNLSDYGNRNTAKALVNVGLIPDLINPSMPSKDFFTEENRFWVPDFIRMNPTDWDDIHLFACHTSQLDDVRNFCDFALEDRGGYFAYSFDLGLTISPCYKLIYRSALDWSGYDNVFVSLDEMLASAAEEPLEGMFTDKLDFAYVYSLDSERWTCYALKDEPRHIAEAERWNEDYEENASDEDFSSSIEAFGKEVDNITADFSAHFIHGFELLESLTPLIYNICGLEDIDEFLDGAGLR